MITIHFNNTTLDVQESDSSYRYRSLMSKPQLVIKFSLSEFVEIPVGAWCEFQGVKYKLGSPENIKKNGTRNIEYTLTLGTLEDNTNLYKMRNPVDKRLKWSMCAKPHELIEAIVWNLNQRDGADVWKVGECLDAAEQTVEFNHTYVDAALQDVANKFETEWEINDYTISLHKVEYFKADPLPLSYGKGNGFEPGVGRTTQSDELPIKRLYVQGGNRNIDRSKYGSAELLLPKSQTLEYEGRTYRSDAEGYSIERIDKVSDAVKEDSLDCSEIYPSREGTVSAVECIDAGKNFYDIIDNSIPAELNFNDYVIEGETATIIFQKGMLAGDDKQFEFKYNHSERRFELVPQEIDGVTMPNETFKPAVGDTYAVFGIMLPDAYICNNADKTGASWDMFREAARKLYENEDQKFTFTGALQGLWAKKNWLRVGGRLKVGGYVLFTDEQFAPDGIPIRITGIKEFLTSPYAPVLEISNSVSGKSVSSQLREIGQNEVTTDNSIRNAVSYTKRRFRDVKETMAMLEDSMLDNFTNSINPLTVQTMMMLVGDESLQFRFVASKTNLTAVSDGVTYDDAAKQLHIPHGFIQHMTLGIGTISSYHADSEYQVWEMNEYLSPYLNNGEKKYYLYAKVSRTNTAIKGDFLLSDRAIKMNDVAGYYHLLVGILNSEYDGERSYVSFYGFSEILPGRITTNKIISSDGKTYFDLLQGEIGGRIVFKSSSGKNKTLPELELSSSEDAQQKADAAKQAAIAAAAADAADKVNAVQVGSVNLIDGSEEITITAPSNAAYSYKRLPLHVRPGDKFALSVKSIEILAGTPAGFTLNISGSDYENTLAGGYITLANRTAVYKIPENVMEQDGWLLVYAGEHGKTNGNSVAYREVMLVKGNRPALTWSPSLNDQKDYTDKAVEEVQGQIDAAQESADKANAMLADIASDDKLTPGEKQEAKREWEIIQGEKPILTAQADTIQLSTADYLAVYNALSAYITPLLADMTTTSTITGAVFSARFKTYYDAKTTLLKNIQYYSSGQFRITTIDATELDPDTYYPVTFTLFSATDCKATFDIGTVLGASGTPPWATHAQGFSCNCAWESNGNRFGTLPVKRYIHSFAYSFAGSTPVGSIGQVNQTSMEYIYVRGGGRYTVRTSGVPFIELHPSGYHWTSGGLSGDVPTRTSVETPVVDVEAAKKTAQDAKDAAASLNTTVTGLKNFTDEAFADGIVDRAEAASIEKYINTVNEAGSAADATYGKLYNNPYLGGSAKTNLTTNKGVFDAAKVSLLNAISAAIADGKASEAEVRNVNAKYTEFNAAYKDFTVSIEAANQAVQNELKSYSDAAQESADGANAMLADIASDDKLTPGEKQEAKREWEIIQGENPILTAQAKPTLTDTTAYLDAYNALSAYITPLLADMTATSTITGSVFRSKFKDYYNARAKLLNNIQYYASGQFQIVTIDATALDPDTYYPVTFNLWNASDSKAAIEISAILADSGTPPWATHAQGFSCSCVWETNGNRWGAMTIKRYIRSFDFRFSDVTPIGSIDQMYQASLEYIYVRGGGKYIVHATQCGSIMLHPTGYSYGDVASIGLLKSVETPVVDVDAAKQTAQSALGAANALSTTVTGLKNFTDSAFADGVVTRSEAAAIGKLTNQVAETAESVKAQYYNRYNHADLNEIGKRNLTAKYALFDAAKAALLTSIATAIADGIATAAEQADVDTKHNEFNSALSELNVAFGVADETIRDAIRAYANSAVGTGQDAVAKNIGFSSYEDMTAKAKAGQTIMDGGRINADLIETATLIAENVITKPASDSDQRRIEIRRETNALAAYDSAGNTVLLVKGDTVDDVNTLINPVAVSLSSDFTPRSFSWSASSELEKYESAVCAELAVTSAGFYKISIPDIRAEHLTHCAAGAYSYGRMDFVLTTSDASDVLVQIPVAKGSAENWRTHVRAGTYTVYAKSRLYLRVRFYGRLEGYASALASESMNVKLYTASQKVTCTGSTDSAMRTSLFANGLAATYSNQEYFVVFKGAAGIPYIMGRGDTRLLSKSGKYGLRLTDSGVLATSNSTNDNNWGALMHGLVAWGIVNTGTGTIAKYWTSPAGNITSLTAAAAGWGYVTITMFGGGFTSTSSYAVDAKPNNTADQVAYASVQNKKTTSFKIGTGNGAGAVATEVVFFIFNLDTYKY